MILEGTSLVVTPDPLNGRTIEIDIQGREIDDRSFASAADTRRVVSGAGAAHRTGVRLTAGASAPHRSPLSPCPLFTFRFAVRRRSPDSDLPTSSDSLNRPFAPRRTKRLSVPVLISLRLLALRRPVVFLLLVFFFAMTASARNSDARIR